MTRRKPALPQERSARFQRAVRTLLARPLLVAGLADPDLFRLIRSQAAELRDWFDRETGWRLVVDAQTARLFKTVPTVHDATYPARDPRSGAPFGRRRYVLTCLALGALERADSQVTLGRLAEQILMAAADPDLTAAGIVFALDNREERSDLIAVVRLLLDWGALHRVAGDEEAYLGASGDALYDVDRRVISGLLTGSRGPSTITEPTFEARMRALTAEVMPDTEELRNRSLRHRLTRKLLEEPVVYYDELTAEELSYLTRQRAAILGRITEATGLVGEVRAEGIAMVDPDDELTDIRMPAQGMLSHLTLLLAGHIAAEPDRVEVEELHTLTRKLAAEHKAYWRKNATDPGMEIELVNAALHALTALKLIAVAGAQVTAKPAIARYALAEPTIRDNGART
ncbi:hypothetical protein Lfu02_49380 [Longispora fulva]|uniref:Uncharacterized protein (TIGR02678 family) n=1 Tax=Longispora fulva TaxID=619741 RepID=A0A8J7KHB5_9ACTN|nr:TIGR02678 family protein [Longispora fulva]MBG6138315.1 uncharacterized protein (TIGR02678 family) [Longispora fulva]GIG60566.1 hypothetical protein Lfu02_49380 [Longispora fulva]